MGTNRAEFEGDWIITLNVIKILKGYDVVATTDSNREMIMKKRVKDHRIYPLEVAATKPVPYTRSSTWCSLACRPHIVAFSFLAATAAATWTPPVHRRNRL